MGAIFIGAGHGAVVSVFALAEGFPVDIKSLKNLHLLCAHEHLAQ